MGTENSQNEAPRGRLWRKTNDNLTIIELAMYVSHVLDRKLLERQMSPSPKSQVMFASAFS